MNYKLIAFSILFLFVLVACNNHAQETLWYKDKQSYQEMKNSETINEIKNMIDDIQWMGTEPSDITGQPDFSFWIGRNKDSIRIVQCDVWRIDSQRWAITKLGEKFDILNRYAEINQSQFNQILEALGVDDEQRELYFY